MRRLILPSLLTATLLPAAALADDNRWLAVGHGGQRMLSADGKTSTQVGSWSKPAHNQDDLNVAASFKGAFYVGGGYFSGRLIATRDGKTWSDGVIPGSSPLFGLDVVGNALYAMDLRGKIFKTVAGEKWQVAATPTMPPPTGEPRLADLVGRVVDFACRHVGLRAAVGPGCPGQPTRQARGQHPPYPAVALTRPGRCWRHWTCGRRRRPNRCGRTAPCRQPPDFRAGANPAINLNSPIGTRHDGAFRGRLRGASGVEPIWARLA